jgi:hypothetical protein
MQTGPVIVLGILILSFLLVVIADLYPKIKRYKLQSPIRKIVPHKRRIRRKAKKKKIIQIKFL